MLGIINFCTVLGLAHEIVEVPENAVVLDDHGYHLLFIIFRLLFINI